MAVAETARAQGKAGGKTRGKGGPGRNSAVSLVGKGMGALASLLALQSALAPAAHAQDLRELFDQRFIEARSIANGERRQLAAVVIVFIVAAVFLSGDAIDGEEAGKGHNGTDGAQRNVAAGRTD